MMIQGRYQIWMLGHWNWKWETYAAPGPRSRLLFNPWRWSYRLLSTFNHIYSPCRYSTNSFPRHEWSVAARLLRGGRTQFFLSLSVLKCLQEMRHCLSAFRCPTLRLAAAAAPTLVWNELICSGQHGGVQSGGHDGGVWGVCEVFLSGQRHLRSRNVIFKFWTLFTHLRQRVDPCTQQHFTRRAESKVRL